MKYKYYKGRDFDKSINDDDFIPASSIFVRVFDATANPGMEVVYSPIGQHGEASIEYINECIEITKKEYLNISSGNYTPADYLK